MPRKVLTTVVPAPCEDGAIQVEVTIPVRQDRRNAGKKKWPYQVSNRGRRPRIPRITRLMALAIKFQGMVDRGEVRGYADLARLGYVTRARITQIMNLLNLAPDIQEEILDLAASAENSALAERQIRSITKIVPWVPQRKAWIDSRDESANCFSCRGFPLGTGICTEVHGRLQSRI